MKQIDDAVQELISSEAFKQDAAFDPKLRVYEGRFKKGKMGLTSKINLLVLFGYEILAKRGNS